MKNHISQACSLAIFLPLLLLMGCMPTVKFGSMPKTEALQTQLTQYESTKADVLTYLGQPRGYGMLRLPGKSDPRVLWFYEYTESDGQTAHIKMLLVAFEGEKYVGHFWFSSVDKVELTR